VEVDEFVIGGQHRANVTGGLMEKPSWLRRLKKKGKKTWPHPLAGDAGLLWQYFWNNQKKPT
jgi:hypothetical protein